MFVKNSLSMGKNYRKLQATTFYLSFTCDLTLFAQVIITTLCACVVFCVCFCVELYTVIQ